MTAEEFIEKTGGIAMLAAVYLEPPSPYNCRVPSWTLVLKGAFIKGVGHVRAVATMTGGRPDSYVPLVGDLVVVEAFRPDGIDVKCLRVKEQIV